ncbi:SMI1/KNR4 family protein [Actinoplanes subtropicus]|uniref:SMI1/KNR4 family protein n=1 Tax=Actinoplanes subtropicus TaxID=543632 RepID=UPI0004C3CFF6|nr:SMI1/KNR4 family protein [Actinoplanes subtropicus]
MTNDRVRELVAAVADGVTATAEQLQGLTEAEIEEVERDQSAPLARSYRQFLELVGRGAGRFLRGSDVFYPSVLGLGDAARALLEENQVKFVLTNEDRVILMHQGYQFDFLRGAGPDPEVWSFCEGTAVEVPTVSFPRFTEWLAAQVKEQTQAWGRLVPWYEAEKAKPAGQRGVFFGRLNPDGSVTEHF